MMYNCARNASKLLLSGATARAGTLSSSSRALSLLHEKDVSLPIQVTDNLNDEAFDSLVIVGNDSLLSDTYKDSPLDEHQRASLKLFKENNKGFDKSITFTVSNNKRLIFSPTGPLNRDYDDVRQVQQAAVKGIKQAISVGSKRPLLFNATPNDKDNQKKIGQLADQTALLGALEAAYNPLEVREFKDSKNPLKIESLGFFNSSSENSAAAAKLCKAVEAIELGRIVARDTGGSDPERMTPANFETYVRGVLESANDCIKLSTVEGQSVFEKEYPSFAAVNRAANAVPRHRGRVVKLEYDSTNGGDDDAALYLVGKGLTYDTGGADIKHGGNMVSMHRDKCGAAFVAGFFKSLAIARPKNFKCVGYLCLARNSIGEECYVTDEIVTARSKQRIRIGNTDAEGRMAICDVLNEAKDLAVEEKQPKHRPHLFTIATLTGHVVLSYGEQYSAVMSNGPARESKIDKRLDEAGESIGDPFEISRIRAEDYASYKGKTDYEDLTQISNGSGARGSRGHQGPAAFLCMASGLDKHGSESEKPLSYTHIDIAGSSGKFPGIPSAAPLPSFFVEWILPRI